MTRKRVLFVDDDPDILASLRSLFWRERQRWDMVFALGGRAALGELAQGSFDIVVSDMRMPGIDGTTLLREVTELYPGTIAILLSGGADAASLEQVSALADHMLEKPCDRNALRAAIDPTP